MELGRFGSYELVRYIDSGGAAAVWLAEVRETPRDAPDLAPGRQVALKRLHDPTPIAPREAVARFGQEAVLMRGIDHPNVVAVYDVDVADGGRGPEPYMAMEYVEGRTLEKVIASGPQDEALVLAVAEQVASGLVALQEKRIVHRDIKPSNLILADDGGVVKIMDFGSARSDLAHLVKTQHGAFIGTPLYVAPEQIGGEKNGVGDSTDLFALGLVLYELLAGEHPYPAGDLIGAFANARSAVPPGLRSQGVSVSPFLEALVLTLLEKAPAGRIAHAKALRTILNEGERSRWWRERPRQATGELPPALLQVRGTGALRGRDGPLTRLRAAWGDVLEGRGRVQWVRGCEGSGKSRIVFEFAEDVAREGRDVAVLYGAAFPGGPELSLGALRAALHQYLGDFDLEAAIERYLGPGNRLAASFAAYLRDGYVPEGTDVLDADTVRLCMAKMVRSIAAERPVLLVVEDLHLGSEEERALFATLAHAIADAAVLLVGTGTDAVPSDWHRAVLGLTHADGIELTPLEDEAVRAMVADRLAGPRVERVVSDLRVRADGNPLYVVEYLRALDESDGITLEHPPPRIRDVLSTRLVRVAPAAREILDLAAVVGYRFDPRIVADVLDRPLVPMLQELSHLQRGLAMIRPVQSDYVFESHALHELLLAELAAPLRAAYHGLVADALGARVQVVASDPARAGPLHVQLVRHEVGASRGERVLDHLAPAVEHVLGAHRHSEAVRLIQRVLDEDGVLEGEARVEWLVRLAHECDFVGHGDSRERAVDEAENLILSTAPPAQHSRLAWIHARHDLAMGRVGPAEAHARRAVAQAAAADDGELQVTSLALLGGILASTGRLDEAESVYLQLLSQGEAEGPSKSRAHAHNGLARIADKRHDRRAAITHFRGCLEEVERLGSLRARAIALLNLGTELAGSPMTDEAMTHLELAGDLSRQIGLRGCEAKVIWNLGLAYERSGDLARARRQIQEALPALESVGDKGSAFMCRLNCASLCCDLGLFGEAEEHAAIAAETCEASTDALGALDLLRTNASLALGRGDAEESARLMGRAARGYRELGLEYEALTCDQTRAMHTYLWGDVERARGLASERGADAERVLVGTDLLWWRATAAAMGMVPPSDAVDLHAEVGEQLGLAARPSIGHLLWRATGEGRYLERAHEALMLLQERVPVEARKTMIQSTTHYRLVVEEWNEREKQDE